MTGPGRMRSSALLVFAVCLLVPGGADAAVPTVQLESGVVHYADTDTTSPDGLYSSQLTYTQQFSGDPENPGPGDVVLRDYQSPFVASNGCQQIAPTDGAVSEALCFGDSGRFDLGYGNDSLSFHDLTAPGINGPPGSFPGQSGMPFTINGGKGDDRIGDGAVADTIHGGDGNDNLVSESGGDDQLFGDDGDDTYARDPLDTSSFPDGADTFDGGSGNDTVSYASRAEPVSVTMNNTADDGRADEHDNIVDAESFVGSPGDDTFVGDSSAEKFAGRGGKDVIRPGLGADTVGDGTETGGDTVSYQERAAPVAVRLHRPGFLAGEAGEGDILKSDVSNALGGSGDDLLVGDGTANVLKGNGGNDYLEGLGGADDLWGGAGTRDRASWHTRTAAVNVSINGSPDDGAPGEGDNVHSDVEGIYGGDGDDTLTGNGSDNFFRGNGGKDSITAGAGLDEILAGEGDDTIFAADGQKDRVKCEGGFDTAQVDAIDVVSDCESATAARAARRRAG